MQTVAYSTVLLLASRDLAGQGFMVASASAMELVLAGTAGSLIIDTLVRRAGDNVGPTLSLWQQLRDDVAAGNRAQRQRRDDVAVPAAG